MRYLLLTLVFSVLTCSLFVYQSAEIFKWHRAFEAVRGQHENALRRRLIKRVYAEQHYE